MDGRILSYYNIQGGCTVHLVRDFGARSPSRYTSININSTLRNSSPPRYSSRPRGRSPANSQRDSSPSRLVSGNITIIAQRKIQPLIYPSPHEIVHTLHPFRETEATVTLKAALNLFWQQIARLDHIKILNIMLTIKADRLPTTQIPVQDRQVRAACLPILIAHLLPTQGVAQWGQVLIFQAA